MANVTVALPDTMAKWIEAQVQNGEFGSVSDYVGDLVRRDFEDQGEELTIEELRERVALSQASGIGSRTLDDLFLEAEQRAKTPRSA